MTESEVQDWLDRYVAAWRSYDPDLIGALFTEDATYRYHPGDEPIVGRDAIVKNWVKYKDEALNTNPWTARYEPWVVGGNRAVAIGQTHYDGADDYFNSFQVTFRDGACSEFVEWFMTPRSQDA